MQAEHAQQEREERKRRQDERRRWREELEKEDQQETAELGMRAEGKWIEIRKIAAKEVYEELVRRRFKLKQEEDKINQAMTKMKGELSPKEREFWWKVAHKRIQTNHKLHAWRISAQGRMPNACPGCKRELETTAHYK